MFPQLLFLEAIFMRGRIKSIQVKPNRKHSHQLLLIPNIDSTLFGTGFTVIFQLLGSVKLLIAVITVELKGSSREMKGHYVLQYILLAGQNSFTLHTLMLAPVSVS